MRKSKRIYIFVLTALILSLSVLEPLCITAADSDKGIKPTTEWTGSEWYQLCAILANKIGAIGDDFVKNVQDFCENNTSPQAIKDKLNMFKVGVSVKNGKVLVSSDAMNALKDIVDAYIEDHGDYMMLPTHDVHDFPDDTGSMPSNFYQQFMKDVKNEYSIFEYWSGSNINSYGRYECFHLASDSVYFVADTGSYKNCLKFYDLNGDRIKYMKYHYVALNSDGEFYTYQNSYNNAPSWCSVPSSSYPSLNQLITFDGHSVKVWKTEVALRNYLRGTATSNKIYVSSTYNNYNVYNDNSVSIDASTAQYIFEQGDNFQMDMSRIVNNVTYDINNYYIDNGTSMSPQDIQNAIDTALQKFLDSLPSGGGEEPTEPETPTETETETETEMPTEPETETGGDISGNDVSGNGIDGPQTVSFLKKIYMRLTDVYVFLKGSMLDALNGIKDAVSGGGVSGNDVSGNNVSGNNTDGPQTVSLLERILDKLSEIKKAILGDTAAGGLIGLITSGIDKLGDFVDSMKDTVTGLIPEVADMAKDIVEGGVEKVGEVVGSVGAAMTPVAEMLPEKFPTCIPWDLAAIITVLVATPEAPVFDVPIVVPSMGIDETLTLDMAVLEPVSKMCRTLLSLLFVIILIQLTIKLTSNNGGDEV